MTRGCRLSINRRGENERIANAGPSPVPSCTNVLWKRRLWDRGSEKWRERKSMVEGEIWDLFYCAKPPSSPFFVSLIELNEKKKKKNAF